MDYSATIPSGEKREQTCENCGAELVLFITKQPGHNEKEEYECPECYAAYYVRASMPPRIVLKSKRSDGK
jgi:DNA-directed RNA polymerase subunit M/transcription elongation factor TFIIS